MNQKYLNLYANFLKRFIKLKRPVKVVFDCSNGTTGIILKKLFQKSNVKGSLPAGRQELSIVLINDKPDGNFPAHGPNPLGKGATEDLKKAVLNHKADLGVIFDADGDRVFFIDNQGRSIDPNEIAYLLIQEYRGPYVIGAVSSWRLRRSNVKGQMSNVYVSRVGHYFFKKLMREKKAVLGLEHSGHYYFKKFFYCDSGILAAIEIINFVSALDSSFSDYLDQLTPYYRSGEINFEITDKAGVLNKMEKIYKKSAKRISKLDGLSIEFQDYWFNLRPSNTENLLRLNLEATSKKVLEIRLKDIKKCLQ